MVGVFGVRIWGLGAEFFWGLDLGFGSLVLLGCSEFGVHVCFRVQSLWFRAWHFG